MRFCDSRYSAQCSCAVGSEVVFIYSEYQLVLFVAGSSAITIKYTWTFIGYLAEIFELAEYFHGGEADCKELVNP